MMHIRVSGEPGNEVTMEQLETDLFDAMSRIRGKLKTISCWESNPGLELPVL